MISTKTLTTNLCTALASLTVACQQTTNPQSHNNLVEKNTPPDVFLIVADDMGYTDLGCYGNTFTETPCLDSLAQAGVRFTQGYATCPVCSPTRASLLTGKYPVTVNVTDWIPGRQANGPQKGEMFLGPKFRNNLDTAQTTLANMFAQAGYYTVHAGKWHLGNEGYLPQHQGFNVNIAGHHCGAPGTYYWPYNPGWCNNPLLDTLSAKVDTGTYLTDALLHRVCQVITQSQPVFLYLPFYQVHIPIQARTDLEKYYTQKAQKFNTSRLVNPKYSAMVTALDQNVRKLLHHWRQQGRLNNTLVLFTSDNGGLSVREGKHTPATDNAPLRGGKGHLFEGGIRVPYIVAGRGVANAGTTSQFKTNSADVLPTLAQAASLPVNNDVEGISLWPLLTNGQQPSQPDLFWHYPHYSNQGGTPGGIVISGQYKYIHSYINQPAQLYDLSNDTAEAYNLTDSLPQVAKKLKTKLDLWLKNHHANMPTPVAQAPAP